MGQAIGILGQIVVDALNPHAWQASFGEVFGDKLLKRATLILCGFVAFEWWNRVRECPLEGLAGMPVALRWAAYTGLLWGLFYLLPTTGSQQFIYFDF